QATASGNVFPATPTYAPKYAADYGHDGPENFNSPLRQHPRIGTRAVCTSLVLERCCLTQKKNGTKPLKKISVRAQVVLIQQQVLSPRVGQRFRTDGVVIPTLAFAAVEITVLNRFRLRQTDQVSALTVREPAAALDFHQQNFPGKIKLLRWTLAWT